MNQKALALALASALLVVVTLSGCARPGSAPADSAGSSQTVPSAEATDSNGMRPGVVPQTRVDPPPGADRPDGPPSTPDRELTENDLAGLITAPASAASTADSCTTSDTRLSLTEADAALGHRYARLIAENTSDRICVLIGWPGLGLRGVWGTAFAIVAERSTIQVDWVGVPPAEVNTAVTLPAGGRAAADFEWTGALGGNREEHVSLIAVQLATGESPAALIVRADGHVDIGPDTTVRVGTWRPAG